MAVGPEVKCFHDFACETEGPVQGGQGQRSRLGGVAKTVVRQRVLAAEDGERFIVCYPSRLVNLSWHLWYLLDRMSNHKEQLASQRQ
jgi:hypothetical protein